MNIFGVLQHAGNALIGVATGDGAKVLEGTLKATNKKN